MANERTPEHHKFVVEHAGLREHRDAADDRQEIARGKPSEPTDEYILKRIHHRTGVLYAPVSRAKT